MSSRRVRVALTLVVFLLFAVLSGTTARGQPAAQPVVVKGIVEPYAEANLTARTPGFITKCEVDVGDIVKEGQVLAEVKDPEGEAELNVKRARLVRAKVGLEQARLALQVADTGEGRSRREIDAARAAVQQAEANAARWKAEKARVEDLATKGVLDQQTLEEVRHQLKAAQEAVQVAEVAVLVAQDRAAEALARRNLGKADVDAAAADVEIARAEFERVTARHELRILRAPFAGLITRRGVNGGEYVSPTEGEPKRPLFTVVRVDKVRVVADVPEAKASGVKPGTQVKLSFPAVKGEKVAATVTQVSWVRSGGEGLLRVEILVPNADSGLQPGMSARVDIAPEADRPGK